MAEMGITQVNQPVNYRKESVPAVTIEGAALGTGFGVVSSAISNSRQIKELDEFVKDIKFTKVTKKPHYNVLKSNITDAISKINLLNDLKTNKFKNIAKTTGLSAVVGGAIWGLSAFIGNKIKANMAEKMNTQA